MVVSKTVLKVDIACEKCKKKLLKAVCGLEGVNKVEADSEKGTLIVIGEADPYDIILQIRKAGKTARFVTVGPPPKPDEPKKTDNKCTCSGASCSACWVNKSCPCPGFSCSGCYICKPVALMTLDYQDPTPLCSIM